MRRCAGTPLPESLVKFTDAATAAGSYLAKWFGVWDRDCDPRRNLLQLSETRIVNEASKATKACDSEPRCVGFHLASAWQEVVAAGAEVLASATGGSAVVAAV